MTNSRMTFSRTRVVFLALLAGLTGSAAAQSIVTQVPSQVLGSGFSENLSINGSFAGPNGFANINNQVTPAFGPNLTGSGLSGGYGFAGGGVSGNVRFNFAQGSSRSISGTSQSMTTSNGYPGSFFSGQVRPFVTGITPIVGSYPTADRSLGVIAAADQQATLSTIAQGNARRQNERLQNYLRRAERAESEGDLKMARANYRLAFGLAGEPLRSMIQTVLRDRFSRREASAAK